MIQDTLLWICYIVSNDVDALWENFIISERIMYNCNRERRANYYYGRTTTQQEIDFVEENGGSFQLFEMKWNPRSVSTKPPSVFTKGYGEMPFSVFSPDNYLDFFYNAFCTVCQRTFFELESVGRATARRIGLLGCI